MKRKAEAAAAIVLVLACLVGIGGWAWGQLHPTPAAEVVAKAVIAYDEAIGAIEALHSGGELDNSGLYRRVGTALEQLAVDIQGVAPAEAAACSTAADALWALADAPDDPDLYHAARSAFAECISGVLALQEPE